MADRTLEIVAQIRDMASSHLRRIGAEGKAAGDSVRRGLGSGAAGSEVLGASVLKAGAQFQGLRKLAGGAMAGIGAGMAAASAGTESMGQAVLRVGTSLATGFAAGGPVGLALAGAGVLIGQIVGSSQKAEEQARKVAEANAAWSKSIRDITDAYREQEAQANANMAGRRTGQDPGLLFARWQDQQAKRRLTEGTADMPGLDAREGERARAWVALWQQVEKQMEAATSGLVDGLRAATGGQGAQEARIFGTGGAAGARDALAARDPVAAARALTEAGTGSAEQAAVAKALEDYEAALARVNEAKQAIDAVDRAARAREADADAARKAADDAHLKALKDQADALGTRLTASEDELRFAKELAVVAELRAKGEEATASWLEEQIQRRKAMDADKAADEAVRKEEERTQAMVDQADQRARVLALSKEDQGIASDLLLIEDLRKRGEAERADTLERIVRQRQAEAKAEQDAAKAQAQAMRDENDLLAAQRDLITDKWEREKQAARDRNAQAKKGGANADTADKVLALELQRIDQDRAKAKAEINVQAERDLELARAATDAERERVQAQHEYLDNLERGVDKKTAELLLAQRLANIQKEQDEQAAKEATSKKASGWDGPRDKHGRPIKPFSTVSPEAMTRREKEARARQAAGLPPVVRMFGPDGPTQDEWNAQRAAKKAASQPAAGGPAGQPDVQQQAGKVQQAVEDAAKKIPNMSALPDPTPFIKRAGEELGKVPPLFDKVTKAQEQFSQATRDAVETVGKATAAAIERVAADVRDLKARVRRVEDRLAAAGKGGT